MRNAAGRHSSSMQDMSKSNEQEDIQEKSGLDLTAAHTIVGVYADSLGDMNHWTAVLWKDSGGLACHLHRLILWMHESPHWVLNNVFMGERLICSHNTPDTEACQHRITLRHTPTHARSCTCSCHLPAALHGYATFKFLRAFYLRSSQTPSQRATLPKPRERKMFVPLHLKYKSPASAPVCQPVIHSLLE